MRKDNPIDRIEWIDAKDLKMNDYNPNTVVKQELKLLEFSILKNGWIQPILISEDRTVIDGFHRALLSKTSEKVIKAFKGQVPCVVMDIDEKDRMMLTIRINRAKGTHNGYKMHKIVHKLKNELNVKEQEIMEQLGMSKKELDLLSLDGVFERLEIGSHEYSMSWKTKDVKK